MALSPFYGQTPRLDPRMLAGIARGRSGMMRSQADPQAMLRRRYDPRQEALYGAVLQNTGARAPQGIAGTLAQLATAFLAARGLRKQGDLRQGEERRAEEAERRKASMEAQAAQDKAMAEDERRAGRLRGVKSIFQRGTGQDLDDDAASVYLENPSLFAGAIKDAQAKPKEDFIRSEVLAMPDGTEVVAHTATQRRELFDRGARPKVAPEAPKGPDIKGESGLRDEYNKHSAEFKKVKASYKRIDAASPTAQGDIALIFNFMKMLDPGSVVRESEYATAANAAGVNDRIRVMYNKVLDGQKLSPEQRARFKDEAKRQMESAEGDQAQREEYYRGLAGQYGFPADRIVRSLVRQKMGAMQGAVTDDDLFAQALGM